VGDEDDRAVVALEGRLELCDGLQVEMVGRLVEDEGVHAARGEERERRAAPLAR
jgi:hypothetical protein